MTIGKILTILKEAQDQNVSPDRNFRSRGIFRSEADRIIDRLLRQGLVQVRAVPGGSRVVLTTAGQKKLDILKLKEVKLEDSEWDGKWRLVLVTVPEKIRKKRMIVNKILAGWGLKEYFRGVWITPYECKKQIENIKNILIAKENIKLVEVTEMEDERKWMRVFGV